MDASDRGIHKFEKKLLKSRGFFLLKAFSNIICGGVQECQHR
ncbi:hypothetical protein PALA111701_09240 [Paenibacillus lactis]|uniref:Uncharacterized protein n=1 Tax=Paenibacillus lactis TaxID=228574 RepID=A0ABS4FIB3_9BACL|nr:hypothetical protein [Paenibacillus lactis]